MKATVSAHFHILPINYSLHRHIPPYRGRDDNDGDKDETVSILSQLLRPPPTLLLFHLVGDVLREVSILGGWFAEVIKGWING